MFIGFWITFMPQYVVGLLGMPRRVASYPSNLGWQSYNVVSTVGAFIIARLVRLPAGELRGLVAQAHPRRQQPVGRPHAGVVHHLAAAAPQLHPPAAHPLGAARPGTTTTLTT